jgi:hypothetical protein
MPVSAHTAVESVKGSSAGEESAKGSSPVNLASSGIHSEKSAKSGKDKWGDLHEEDTSKEDAKGLNEDDGITTDESEDENEAEAEAAEARKRRSDSIVDVRSSSELKEGVKGPGSATKPEDQQSSSSELKEATQALSAEEIDEELHANRMARGKAIVEKFRADKEITKGSARNMNWNAPEAYERYFRNTFGEVPLSAGALKALKSLGTPSEDAAREPSPMFTQIMGKFKKAKPTAVACIPLDQRLVDPSSLEKERIT